MNIVSIKGKLIAVIYNIVSITKCLVTIIHNIVAIRAASYH